MVNAFKTNPSPVWTGVDTTWPCLCRSAHATNTCKARNRSAKDEFSLAYTSMVVCSIVLLDLFSVCAVPSYFTNTCISYFLSFFVEFFPRTQPQLIALVDLGLRFKMRWTYFLYHLFYFFHPTDHLDVFTLKNKEKIRRLPVKKEA